MKLIINIPDDDYEFVKEQVDSGYCNDVRDIDNRLYHFVANGTVLKQGKWIDEADEIDAQFERHEYKCSECGRIANYYVGGYESWWDIYKPNYCPNCGAEMGGEHDD